VAGGIGTGGIVNSAELYDPTTGLWSATGSMRMGRAYFAAALLPNGNVLVAGGCTNSSCSAGTPTAEIYNPANGKWRSAGKMSTLRYFFAATPLPNGNILVEGGCNKGNCGTVAKTAELFNPTTRSWALTGSLKTGRDYHTATLLSNGKVLVTGGYTVQGASTSVEMYDPATATWSAMAGMTYGRALHSATALTDGRAVVAGGVVSYLPSDLSELYDPVTNKWSLTGNLITKRAGQTAVLLSSGNPMLMGGYTYVRPVYFEVSSCELFDPVSGTWSYTGDMTTARDDHATVLLGSGQVLVAGGISGSSILSSAEIYTP
jgi:N-acetylneuraminic acid mutarotase